MVLLQVKAIKPQVMNIDQVRRELLAAVEAEGREVQKLYKQTVSTWSGDKPTFESLTEIGTDDVTILTGPDGSKEALDKFKWLDEGTRIRWAIMSSDWKSKTKPGKLKSGRGRGRVLVVGKRHIKRPRPGIKPRKWTELIGKRRRKPFTKRLIKAKNKGLAKLYG